MSVNQCGSQSDAGSRGRSPSLLYGFNRTGFGLRAGCSRAPAEEVGSERLATREGFTYDLWDNAYMRDAVIITLHRCLVPSQEGAGTAATPPAGITAAMLISNNRADSSRSLYV